MGLSDLPCAPASAHVKALERLGWTKQPKRGKGSHIIMTKPKHPATLSIPCHGDVKRGTLAALLRAAGISVDEYLSAYKGKR